MRQMRGGDFEQKVSGGTARAGALNHPCVIIAGYLAAFLLAVFLIQKADDVGSGWTSRSAHSNSTSASASACNISFLDLSSTLVVGSPQCSQQDLRSISAASQSLPREWRAPPTYPASPGFCTPTAPWFWHDLGGTICVCEKRWDVEEYWAKTFSSFAFNFPHFMTPFQIYIVYQRWMWVFIYMLFNEVRSHQDRDATG